MGAEQDRFLRTKLSEDSSHLVKENALLNQQVLELTKQIERVSFILLWAILPNYAKCSVWNWYAKKII